MRAALGGSTPVVSESSWTRVRPRSTGEFLREAKVDSLSSRECVYSTRACAYWASECVCPARECVYSACWCGDAPRVFLLTGDR